MTETIRLSEWQRQPAEDDPDAEQNRIINLISTENGVLAGSDRAVWNELSIESVPASSQGLVDAIVAPDGYIYIAYFDDGPPAAIYVKRSIDGGATWQNPDSGANGFALNNLFMDRPSIEVFESTPGTFRLAVAVSAPWPYTTSPNDIIVCWKDIGSGDNFSTVSVQNDTSENYLRPRLKAIQRPSNPSLKRIVCASYGYSDGRLWCDYSDTNATSFGNYSAINPATDQVEIWRADFVEDLLNTRLYCIWSVAFSSTPNNPSVFMALSTNRGNSWFPDLFRMAPSSWNTAAESDAAVASNPLQPDKTLMIAWTGIQTSGAIAAIHYSYQFLDAIQVGPGSIWNPSPAGSPVTYGLIYSDSDYDNSMPTIQEDNRFSDGGYRVAFLDQHLPSAGRMRYTECDFSTPVDWMEPEVVSGLSAAPAYSTSSALSSGVGYNATTYPDRRCVTWPDYRSGTKFDMWAAWADVSESPPPTATPEPTSTPEPTLTPEPTSTPTATPPPIPSTTPMGVAILAGLLGLIICRRDWKN